MLLQHIDQYPHLKQGRELLESIPGIGPVVSRYMLSVLRSREFESGPQSAAFLGLVPVHHESGSSVRGRARLSKTGNTTVRAKLYMAAIVAIQHNPDIQKQYERLLKNGKTKMSALGAPMRKLVQICFGVLNLRDRAMLATENDSMAAWAPAREATRKQARLATPV